MRDFGISGDTIVAISTAPGRGGIGVVRLSGESALRIATCMFRSSRQLEPGRAVFGELLDTGGGRLDEAVVTYFRAPHSYTREDVVEIAAHGSPVLLEQIVRQASATGARVAEPGEFTRRALLNGRINLTQAEAVRDLIEAQTLYQVRMAAQQLEGALSKRVSPVKTDLVQLIAMLEAGIDFADDDVDVIAPEQVRARIAKVRDSLDGLLRTFRLGNLVHEGVTLAIVGRPNVGKSSLFNRLLERERAIVTDIPGTTRDLVSETVSLRGVPLRLVDTAGIRDLAQADQVERIGIERSYEALAAAGAILLVFDAGQGWTDGDEQIAQKLEARDAILVANKSDVARTDCGMAVSAKTGDGVAELRDAIWARVSGGAGAEVESGALTNARHESLVRHALQALEKSDAAVQQNVPHEMLLMDLYEALRALDSLTGETTPDDVLNLIFGSFCIGK